MTTEIKATYRVVTPMFCAGADRAQPEVRIPSFKGVLRFWWRALAWSRLDGDLQRIQQDEASLFGSAGKGQSSFTLQLEIANRPPTYSQGCVLRSFPGAKDPVGIGANYLGYGLMEAKRQGELIRACLSAPFDFSVRLRSRGLSDGPLKSLEQALIAVGLFGAMGARSRKGWGSLSLHSFLLDGKERWCEPGSIEMLKSAINTIRNENDGDPSTPSSNTRTGLPQYTALSKDARYLLLQSDERHPLALLNLIGLEIKNAIRSVPRKERVVFGLPRSPHANLRRASPLFIHIHACSPGPVAVLSFLPARFLLKNTSRTFGGRRDVRRATEDDVYRPVDQFLTLLLAGNSGVGRLRTEEVRR